MTQLIAVLAVALTMYSPYSPISPGAIDTEHSRVTFTVTKWGFEEVEGRFHDFTGTILYDANTPERSHVEWRVKVATVTTGATQRDQNLQTPEFFDSAKFPDMRFVSTRVQVAAPGELDVTGTLTIKGVSRELTVRVHCLGRHRVESSGVIDAFSTSFVINRHDFGVDGPAVFSAIISSEATITLTAAARVGS
jgi:polyisoprenoid-binding protein YceI